MDRILVDFSKETGKIKPMHAVNNGPIYKFREDQRITNIHHFQAAGIPYVRNHDASFEATYGGEHIVDVNFIFRDFDADPYDPESYDFRLTDDYLKIVELGGGKNYYRLGSKIEHWPKKYNTLPPKDFRKWAVICEHIIKHYTQGWADGFYMDIEYWEIWNEPDLDSDDSDHKRCWGGTAKEFYELFNITLKHLKKTFPNLKIGGPASAGINDEWLKGLFESLDDVKPDFYSWHVYASDVKTIQNYIHHAEEIKKQYGLHDAESILNEWNYIKGWEDDEFEYSVETIPSLKGSSFIASTMLMSQNEPLDMLMYYDARPCAFCGLFKPYNVSKTMKGYYPFYMFNQLYKLGTAVEATTDTENVWVVAAKDNEQNIMISHFNDNDDAPAKDIKVEFKNVNNQNGVRLEYYVLDENHDCSLIREEIFTSTEFAAYIKLPVYTTYLLKILPL